MDERYETITISVESFQRMERRLKEFYILQMFILPQTPIDELVDLTARDFRDAINARIEEGRKI